MKFFLVDLVFEDLVECSGDDHIQDRLELVLKNESLSRWVQRERLNVFDVVLDGASRDTVEDSFSSREDLVYSKLGLFWQCDNRHIKNLGVFLHHEGLNILAEHLFSIRVVLFVFVNHDLLSLRKVGFIFIPFIDLL